MDSLLSRAAQIVSALDVAVIAVLDETGSPAASTVSRIRNDGIREIVFTTNLSGSKGRRLQKDPRASVCFQDGQNNVTLIGDVQIRTDPQLKKDLWLEWFVPHFGAPDNPDYCVLLFHPTRMSLWIDGQGLEGDIPT